MAKRALPFKVFPDLAALKKRHVTHGNINEKRCREMTSVVAEALEGEMKAVLAKMRYFSILRHLLHRAVYTLHTAVLSLPQQLEVTTGT